MGEMLFAVRMKEDAEYRTISDLNHRRASRAYKPHENSILLSEPGKL